MYMFIKAIPKAQIPPSSMKKVTIEGTDILITNIDNTYYAIANKCPHMGGSLAEGKLKDGIVSCPRHGAMFDVRTGKNVAGAKLGFIHVPVKDAKTFILKDVDGDIMIEI